MEDSFGIAEALDALARCLQRIAVIQAVPGSEDADDEVDGVASGLTETFS